MGNINVEVKKKANETNEIDTAEAEKSEKQSLKDKIFAFLKSYVGKIIECLFCGYVVGGIFFIVAKGEDVVNKLYADKISLIFLLVLTLAFGFVSFVVDKYKYVAVRWQIVVLSTVYVFLTELKMPAASSWLCFAYITILVVYVFEFCPQIKGKMLKDERTTIAIIGIITAVIVWFMAYGTYCRLNSMASSCYDMGIFAQMFEYMAKTGVQYTSMERGYVLSHFSVHFSPCWYLILPFYMIFRNYSVLVIAQAVIVASGVIPCYLLAKNFKLSKFESIMFCVVYLFYPAFNSAQYFDVHENAFLAAFVLWLFYFLETKKRVGIIVMSLLVLTVKEDAGFYLIFMGLYGLTRVKRSDGLMLTAIGVVGFVAENIYINMYGEGVKDNRFDIYITDENTGLIGVVVNVFKNPAYFLSNLLSDEKLIFLLIMVVPMMFLCLRIKHGGDLFLIVPFVLVNLSPAYVYQHSVDFHYIFGSGAMLYCLFAVNVSESKQRGKILVCSALSSVLLCCYCVSDKYQLYHDKYTDAANMSIVRETENYIDSVDKSSVIYADTYVLSLLYKFDKVYLIDGKDSPVCKYVMLDNRNTNIEEEINKYKTMYPNVEVHGYVTCLSK